MKTKVNSCNECGGRITTSRGELVCDKCGLVYERVICHPQFVANPQGKDLLSSPRSHFAPGNRLNRVDGLGSYIGYWLSGGLFDVRGKPLSRTSYCQYSRLRVLHNRRLRFTGHETDYQVLCLLNRVAELLRLPNSVRDRAAYLYRKMAKMSAKKRPSSTTLLMVCLLNAVRESTTPDPPRLHEIAKVFKQVGHGVSARKFIKAGLFCDALGLKLRVQKSETYLPKIIRRIVGTVRGDSPFSEWDRYEERLLRTGFDILRGIDSVDRGGRDPYALAASTIYAADRKLASSRRAKPQLTQKIVSRASGVAEYTIREHWVELLRGVI